MSDSTRDIAIKTQTEVAQLRVEVSELKTVIGELKTDFNERKGTEKLAKWIIGLGSGVSGGLVAKLATALMGFPLPK